MLKITDPDKTITRAILNTDGDAVKVVENALKIRMIRYDEMAEPHIDVVCTYTTIDGLSSGVTHQLVFTEHDAADLMDKMQSMVDEIEKKIVSGVGVLSGNTPITVVADPNLPNHLTKIKEELRKKPKKPSKGPPPRPIIPGVPQ